MDNKMAEGALHRERCVQGNVIREFAHLWRGLPLSPPQMIEC
jgi:hypothetical protein